MTEHPQLGWVRGSEVPTADVLNEMSRLSKENAELREQLSARNEEGEIDTKIGYLGRQRISIPLREGDPIETDLLVIFDHCGLQLTIPTTTQQIAELIVSSIRDQGRLTSEPEGPESNPTTRAVIKDYNDALNWLAELSILELVDSTLYQTQNFGLPPQTVMNWTLTTLGKRTLARLQISERERGEK
jgi:hypothetical protein